MKLRACLFFTLMLGGMAANLAAQQMPPPANPGKPSAPKAERALSDELNKELPKWLRFRGEYRARLEGFTGGGFKPHNDDLYLLSRLRLNMLIQASDWVKFAFQAQDGMCSGKTTIPRRPRTRTPWICV